MLKSEPEKGKLAVWKKSTEPDVRTEKGWRGLMLEEKHFQE